MEIPMKAFPGSLIWKKFIFRSRTLIFTEYEKDILRYHKNLPAMGGFVLNIQEFPYTPRHKVSWYNAIYQNRLLLAAQQAGMSHHRAYTRE